MQKKEASKPKMHIFRPESDKDEHLNYGDRPPGMAIDTIVIHYTAGEFRASYLTLTAPRGVSAHYLIKRDGKIYDLVDDQYKAWHAGSSSWHGNDAVNDFSIGIELINSGSGQRVVNGILECDDRDDFSVPQMTSLCSLINYLKGEFKIENQNIVGHSDITAWNARSPDPGMFFDWQFLADNGHGLYSKFTSENPKILYEYGCKGEDILNLQNSLEKLGYKIHNTSEFDVCTLNVVRAFNMHFHQDTAFSYEVWDDVAHGRLNDLLLQMM